MSRRSTRARTRPRFVRRRALLALASAAPAAAWARESAAQASSAQAFLEAIYRPYLTKGHVGADYTKPERYFTSDLAAAMQRDFVEARRRNEVPALNGDPFINAQDWDIDRLNIRVAGTAAEVSFTNFGKQVRVALQLAETQAGWRIRDIAAPSGSLRALYRLR